MELTFECPSCQATGRVADVETAREAVCGACGDRRPLRDDAFDGGDLGRCAWCATEDLYIQKDFPHSLGLAIVAAGFVASTIFWAYYMQVAALGVLMVTAALDVILYYVVPDVTICYRCLGQYRGPGSNPGGRYAPFDLAIGERYRQERLRIEELRRRQGSAGPRTSA